LRDYMKITGNFFLFFFISLTFHICVTYGADWLKYDEDIEGNFLYVDKDSITDINGITYVWQKKVYYKDNLFRIRQILGERYYKLIEKITLYEIHCPTKQVQDRVFAYYDSNGGVIDSSYNERKRDWKKILSGTDMVILYRICCEQDKKK
jgi:hypothetical protein